MTVQIVNPKRSEHLRAFNPDRDMIWAMPRLMRRVFESMGELTEESLVNLMATYSISPAGTSLAGVGCAARDIAKMFNLMQQHPEKAEAHADWFSKLKLVAPDVMSLIWAMLMDIIISELPMWFDQVRPASRLAPVPSVEEIERAADAFLGRINTSEE